MSQDYLTEAFKALESLNEDVFDLDQDGLNELKDFSQADDEESTQDIIDPEAETEDDIKDSYIGKVVLRCSICQSCIYKDPEDIVIDEETDLANVDEECPQCYGHGGFEIIGQISEFDPNKLDDEEKNEEKEKNSEDEVDINEVDIKKDDEEDEKALEESLRRRRLSKHRKLMNESKKSKSRMTRKRLAEDYSKVTVENEDKSTVVDTQEDGTVNVTIKPNDTVSDSVDLDVVDADVNSGDEVIEPISNDTIDTIENNTLEDEEMPEEPTNEPDEDLEEIPEVDEEEEDEEDEDEDFDSIEEEDFDNLGESYLKRVYNNVDSFKTSRAARTDKGLMLEGMITFKSGKQAKTRFMFESIKNTKGRVKLVGYNEHLGSKKDSYTMYGKVNKKHLMLESLTYNYSGMDVKTSKSARVYGTVRSKKKSK